MLKTYLALVIAGGVLVLGPALMNWESADPDAFAAYMAFALFSSMLKMKLPGLQGTYSLGFLFVLVGILHFSLPETLVVGCVGALVQSVWLAKTRPTPVQVLFNVGNLSLSIGICYKLAHGPLAGLWGPSDAAGLTVVACLFFVINTGIVSGVLSLLQGKSLGEVSGEWYLWSFPYYLIGAIIVSLLPLSGKTVQPEAMLLLLPPLVLIHFFYSLSLARHPSAAPEDPEDRADFPLAARVYLALVVTAGLALLSWSLIRWESEHLIRFVTFLAVIILLSTLKVRLPGLTVTISLNYVLLLSGVMLLSLSELMVVATSAALVQCVWNVKRRPQTVQLFFAVATLVLSTALGFFVVRIWLASFMTESLPFLLVAATVSMYLSNSLLVSLARCKTAERPLRDVWQECCFWSFPYYLVGAGFAAVMVWTSQAIGWQQSFFVLPLMLLVYVSYRLHVGKAARARVPARPVPSV